MSPPRQPRSQPAHAGPASRYDESELESTQIPILFLDRDLRIKRFTRAASGIFGLIENDLGRLVTDVVPRFEGEMAADFKEVLRTLAAKERQVPLADGSATFLMRVLPCPRADNQIGGLVLLFLDLTGLNRAWQHQASLAAIVESSQDAIVGRTFGGIITSWNQAAMDMFGYTPQEAIGSPISLIVPTEAVAQMESVHDELNRGAAVAPFETVRYARDGTRLIVSVAVSPMKNAEGRPIGISAIFRDITELKQAQEVLEREAHERDQFMAVLSHELRNPLAPLRTSLELLRNKPPEPAALQQSLGIMDRQLSQLTALADQLLDAALISSGKILLNPEDVDLVNLVSAVVEDHGRLFEGAGLRVELNMPSRPVFVKADRLRISQALGNLLDNSAKFTQRGGTVGVTLRALPEDRHNLITVKDTGVGIDPKALGRMFQPFIQAGTSRRGGLGLGLWLVKALVESHGGSVEAQSAGEGQGTEFTISLPSLTRSRPPPDWKPQTPGGERERPAPRRILIVEDNADTADSLRRLLESQGHTVQTAATGLTAIEAARSFRAEVVLCDLQLGGDTDGFAVAAAIRGEPDGSPYLIALTGYGQSEDRERTRAAGFDWHLTKPPSPDELTRLLADLPRRPQS